MGGGLKRLLWVGGPSPAKKAPSVGFVYFCVPHKTQHLAQTTKQPGRQALALPEVGSIAPALLLSVYLLCVYNFSIPTILPFLILLYLLLLHLSVCFLTKMTEYVHII